MVPAEGELLCDLRADRLESFDPLFAALPEEHDEVRLDCTMVRAWPGLDSREETAHYLSENFELDDPDALLDEVYARVSG